MWLGEGEGGECGCGGRELRGEGLRGGRGGKLGRSPTIGIRWVNTHPLGPTSGPAENVPSPGMTILLDVPGCEQLMPVLVFGLVVERGSLL